MILLDPVKSLVISIIAFGIGILAAMLGIGGGVLMVPILNQGFQLDMHSATGTSLVVIIFTAFSSSTVYYRQKRIHYRLGVIYAAVTIPGAITGAIISAQLSQSTLQILFGIVMMPVALRMILSPKKRRTSSDENQQTGPSEVTELLPSLTPQQYSYGLFLGFLAGMASGLLGIGGGAVAVPTLTLVIGLPMHVAVATSSFVMIFTSIAGVTIKIWDKDVAWAYVPWMILGVILGTQVGARIAKRIRGDQLQQIFGFVLLAVLLRMTLVGLGIF